MCVPCEKIEKKNRKPAEPVENRLKKLEHPASSGSSKGVTCKKKNESLSMPRGLKRSPNERGHTHSSRAMALVLLCVHLLYDARVMDQNQGDGIVKKSWQVLHAISQFGFSSMARERMKPQPYQSHRPHAMCTALLLRWSPEAARHR